jgi:hypothetical protein
VLSEQEVHELESTLLPALERHHLRLLAHGLRTLQGVAERRAGDPPDPARIEAWARSQPQIGDDTHFLGAFVEQLDAVGRQLAEIGRDAGRAPLALELEDLVAWARRLADGRLSRDLDPTTPAGAAPAPPPG